VFLVAQSRVEGGVVGCWRDGAVRGGRDTGSSIDGLSLRAFLQWLVRFLLFAPSESNMYSD